jgi:hypothetical protein
MSKNGCDRAQQLIEEARRLRARDGSGPDRRQEPRPDSPERRLLPVQAGLPFPPVA